MQLQIECNQVETKRQCCVCKQQFEMQQARIIVCCDQAIQSGDLCPSCLHRGYEWIKDQVEQLNLEK